MDVYELESLANVLVLPVDDDINKLIQETKLSAINHYRVLKWIPYNKFYDIEYTAKGGFGKVYKAKWIDGYIHHWDNENQMEKI
ncbi:hypothetical protein RhiirA1_454072 [Rhizophagus irregularis]|uniref:Protein kinase domain-containing protein n=1 Tax=Rhizophagus irregularis TaxID=588596 RepID=A0A2N0S622_9GLOM|nr:hypothetical protein RhiirA1_454072 [Rhizophagus irregularis]